MRKAVIGMMQQAVLAGMESGISEALGQEAEPGGYHDALVYSAMIHAGVGGFVVPGHRQGEVAPDLPLTWNGTSEIRSKCDYVDDEYFQLHQFFMDLLWSNALEKVEADKSFYQLALFLTDLSFAMANSTAIVSVFDFPNPKNYYGHLNLRLVMALERLVNGVTPLSLDLIIPTFEVDRKNSTVLLDVLDSASYKEYEVLHAQIDAGVEPSKMAPFIKKKAGQIRSKYGSNFSVGSVVAAVSPVAVSFFDEFVGGTAASIVQGLADKVSNAFDARRKIVIYDYGVVHRRMLYEHYRKVAEIRGSQSNL